MLCITGERYKAGDNGAKTWLDGLQAQWIERWVNFQPRNCCAVLLRQLIDLLIDVVKAIWRNGVYFMRTFSPLGRNAQQCCNSYGVWRVSLHSIQAVCKKLAWSMFYRNLDQPELDKIQTIKELLCVKYGLLSLPSNWCFSDRFYTRVTVYFLTFTYFLCVLCVRFYIKYIEALFTFNNPKLASLCKIVKAWCTWLY